jgi:hypothetical protein
MGDKKNEPSSNSGGCGGGGGYYSSFELPSIVIPLRAKKRALVVNRGSR